MATFFERHKRKGVLALLSLLFKRSKGTIPLVFMVALLACIFVMPQSLGTHFPWINKALQRIRPNWLGGGSELMSYSEQVNALRMARLTPIQWWGSRWGGLWLNDPNKSSLDAIKGNDLDDLRKLHGKGGSGYSDLVRGGGGETINGILTPQDADKKTDGVRVSAQELEKGLYKWLTQRGLFSGDGQGVRSGALDGSSPVPLGGPGMVRGGGLEGSALDPTSQLVQGTLNTKLPPGAGGPPKVVATGKLSDKRHKLSLKKGGALQSLDLPDRDKHMLKLVQTRAVSVVADQKCPEGACPKEFASHTAGLTADGSKVDGKDLLTSSEFNDPVNIPDLNSIQTEIDKANGVARRAEKCEAKVQKNTGEIEALMARIRRDSDALEAACHSISWIHAICCMTPLCDDCDTCTDMEEQVNSEISQLNTLLAENKAACDQMEAAPEVKETVTVY